MSIEDLLEEVKEEGEDEKPESLKDLSRVKYQKDKLHKDHLCPHCGSNNTEEKEYYWRCKEPKNECEVVTYIPA